MVKNSNGMIWEISNLLTYEETQTIINSSESIGFEHLKHRNFSRLIAFESNNVLTNLIKSKLIDNCVLNIINNKKYKTKPYGFYFEYIDWNILEPNINQCYRINKYSIGQEFKFHRDA